MKDFLSKCEQMRIKKSLFDNFTFVQWLVNQQNKLLSSLSISYNYDRNDKLLPYFPIFSGKTI